MKEELIKGRTLTQAYHLALKTLNYHGDISDCGDWNCTQKEISMTMQVLEPLAEPMISRLFIGGQKELQQYVMEMLDGILDFEIDKGNWTYTYHDRMVNYRSHNKVYDQIQFVISELTRNPSSRRAVVVIRDVGVDAESDDPACLQHLQYFQ